MNYRTIIILILGIAFFLIVNIILQWDCWVSAKCAHDEYVAVYNSADYHIDYGLGPTVPSNYLFFETFYRSCTWVVYEILIVLIALVLMIRFCWLLEEESPKKEKKKE